MSRISLSLFLLCVSTFTSFGQLAAPRPAPQVFDSVGIDQRLNEQIPLDLDFTDENGNLVTLKQYFGKKPVIISLVYYKCPMLCNQVLNGMVETFKTLKYTAGGDFEVITVSIDPSEGHELASEKKQHYIEEYERATAADGWHFLVGNQKSITALAGAVGFRYLYDARTGQFAHSSGIMVATPDGRLARYHYGIEYGARDLIFSMVEASKGNIGSPVDKLLLLCYHYDPTTGKYGVVVGNVLRIAGGTTILILGGYMLVNFLRDRKKSRTVPSVAGKTG